jgi:predicted  nucleic acid-binding Zn-ribbon protein
MNGDLEILKAQVRRNQQDIAEIAFRLNNTEIKLQKLEQEVQDLKNSGSRPGSHA